MSRIVIPIIASSDCRLATKRLSEKIREVSESNKRRNPKTIVIEPQKGYALVEVDSRERPVKKAKKAS